MPLVLALALGAALFHEDDPRLVDLDRQVLADLRDTRETERATFHYRAEDVTAEQVDAAVVDMLSGFERLEPALDMRYEGRIHVFLYEDHADLEARTGSGAVAFSCGTVSLHQTHDFRGVHELVHLFAVQFPREADAESDLFVVEGLATILAESDEGVPIHSWAAVDLSVGRLPDLLELRATFPEGAGSGVHPYHVAGSFVGFLLERHGVLAVKRWYVCSTEAGLFFGQPFRTLECEWREWLGTVEVEPVHRAHVLKKLGLSEDPLPAAYRDAPGTDLLSSGTLESFDVEDRARWTLQDGVLSGAHDGPWTRLHTKQSYGPRLGMRVRFRMIEGDAFGLRLNRTEGAVDEAIFARWSTYLSAADGFAGNETVKLSHGAWHDAVLVHEDGTCRLYLNGVTVLVSDDPPATTAGTVGLGLERGRVEVSRWEVFALE